MLRSSRTMRSKNRSVSSRIDIRRYWSKSGNFSTSGLTFSSARNCSHCPPNSRTSDAALGSCSMRRTSAASTSGFRSDLLSACVRSAWSGMLAHRKYDRRVASSCWLTAPGAPRGRGVILLETEQEVGRHQQRLQRDRDAVVERLAALPRLSEERGVAGHILGRHRAAERSLGQRRHDARGATGDVAAAWMTADEDLRAAFGRRPAGLRVGPADLHVAHAGVARRVARGHDSLRSV